MKLTRDFYIPRDAQAIQRDGVNAVAYLYDSSKARRPAAVGFRGNANKPAFNYSFRDEERRAQYIAEFLAEAERSQKAREERKAAQRAERAAFRTSLKVGDVLSYSWGYDQTNVEFFQVVKVYPSGKMVDIQEIASDRTETGYMSGQCEGIPGALLKDSKPIRKPVQPGDVIPMKFGVARKASGKQYYSYYA